MTALSIVILSWNRGDLLEQCLRHIDEARLPWGEVEVVLLDNGSTDPSVHDAIDVYVENADMHPVKVRKFPSNMMNAAYNLASDLYEGDNILLVNTDCFVRPDTISKMLEAKAAGESWEYSPGVVGAQLLYGDGRVQHGGVTLDRTTRLPAHRYRYAPGPYANGSIYRGEWLPGVTGALIMFDRQCWETMGGVDAESFPLYFTDIDFCLRAWEKGWATVYAEDAVATHLEAASHVPTGGLPAGYLEQQARYLAKWGPGSALPAPVQRMVYG